MSLVPLLFVFCTIASLELFPFLSISSRADRGFTGKKKVDKQVSLSFVSFLKPLNARVRAHTHTHAASGIKNGFSPDEP